MFLVGRRRFMVLVHLSRFLSLHLLLPLINWEVQSCLQMETLNGSKLTLWCRLLTIGFRVWRPNTLTFSSLWIIALGGDDRDMSPNFSVRMRSVDSLLCSLLSLLTTLIQPHLIRIIIIISGFTIEVAVYHTGLRIAGCWFDHFILMCIKKLIKALRQ